MSAEGECDHPGWNNDILRFWISDTTEGLTNIRGNVYLALWDTFRVNGAASPFPQREVRLLKDEIAPEVAARGGFQPKLRAQRVAPTRLL